VVDWVVFSIMEEKESKIMKWTIDQWTQMNRDELFVPDMTEKEHIDQEELILKNHERVQLDYIIRSKTKEAKQTIVKERVENGINQLCELVTEITPRQSERKYRCVARPPDIKISSEKGGFLICFLCSFVPQKHKHHHKHKDMTTDQEKKDDQNDSLSSYKKDKHKKKKRKRDQDNDREHEKHKKKKKDKDYDKQKHKKKKKHHHSKERDNIADLNITTVS
jgi:hypothetical protein